VREIRKHLPPLCGLPSHHNLVFGRRQHDSIVERHLDLLFRAPGEEEQVSIRDLSEQRGDRISAPAPPTARTWLAEAVIVGVVGRTPRRRNSRTRTSQ
jgi:hypothetical protein